MIDCKILFSFIIFILRLNVHLYYCYFIKGCKYSYYFIVENKLI